MTYASNCAVYVRSEVDSHLGTYKMVIDKSTEWQAQSGGSDLWARQLIAEYIRYINVFICRLVLYYNEYDNIFHSRLVCINGACNIVDWYLIMFDLSK